MGDSNIVVAGGQESMSSSPYLLSKARDGYRMGNAEIIDSMINDGLWDCYNNMHMGNCGELCADEYNITRKDQDDFAVLSYTRALEAQKNGSFNDEIVKVMIESRKGNIVIDKDEEPEKANLEKGITLKAAFKKDGTVTAFNASSIDDGASALVIASETAVANKGILPLAKIIAHATHAQKPEWFTTAPATAISKVLSKANMKIEAIDLFEINEAFASVPLVTNKLIGVPIEKINVHGGAIALGHPIGASGARILTTLIYALRKTNKKFGIASLCIGGGEAVAMIIERI